MSVHKGCADHLRASYNAITGSKLVAGHAHELVAAFFGYSTAAAMRAEVVNPLTELPRADILIPDLALMDARRQQIAGLPADLPDSDAVATALAEHLVATGQFSGAVWHTRDLAEYLNTDFIQRDPMMIEEDLASEIATTNAYFDELYVEEVEIERGDAAMIATVTGSLNGETDQDRVFYGDSIKFETVMTFDRVAGRTGYAKPILETGGAVDQSMYYDE